MRTASDMRTLAEWWRSDTDCTAGYSTMSARRREAGVGTLVPPKTWLLTAKEWETVKKTPLHGCARVLK